MGRAVPNSQEHPGTGRAAADGHLGQDLLSSCPGIARLPGDGQWRALAAIWGLSRRGFWGRGGPALLCVGLGAADEQMLLCGGGGAVIAERDLGDRFILVSVGPAAASALLCPPAPCPSASLGLLSSLLD